MGSIEDRYETFTESRETWPIIFPRPIKIHGLNCRLGAMRIHNGPVDWKISSRAEPVQPVFDPLHCLGRFQVVSSKQTCTKHWQQSIRCLGAARSNRPCIQQSPAVSARETSSVWYIRFRRPELRPSLTGKCDGPELDERGRWKEPLSHLFTGATSLRNCPEDPILDCGNVDVSSRSAAYCATRITYLYLNRFLIPIRVFQRVA